MNCLTVLLVLGALTAVALLLVRESTRRNSPSEDLPESGTKKPTLKKIGITSAKCPYCNRPLEKMPGRKKKCPHCKEFIFVRTRPLDKKKILVTESQIGEVEEQWAIGNDWHEEFIENRRQERELFANMKKKLAAQFECEPSDGDVQWAILNQSALEFALLNQWGHHRNVKFSMAEQLGREGKTKGALSFYAQVLYLDTLGPTNSERNPFDRKQGFFAPGILKRVMKELKRGEVPQDEFERIFLESVTEHFEVIEEPPITATEAWGLVEHALFLIATDREAEVFDLPKNFRVER